MAGKDWEKDYKGPAVEGTKHVLESAAKEPCEYGASGERNRAYNTRSQPSSTSSLPLHSPRSVTSASLPLNRKARPTQKKTGIRFQTKTVKSSRLTRKALGRFGIALPRSLRSSLRGISRRRPLSSCPPSVHPVSKATAEHRIRS